MKFQQTGTGDDSNDVCIELNDPCTLTFSVKYLNWFTKGTTLCDRVTLSLSQDTPLGKQRVDISNANFGSYAAFPVIL